MSALAKPTQEALVSIRAMMTSDHDVTLRELGEFLSHVGLGVKLTFKERRFTVSIRQGGLTVARGTGKDALLAFREALLAAIEAARDS